MKNKSISRVLAIALSCALCIPSNAVYVYAQPNSNEIESECDTESKYDTGELTADYEESVSEEIHDSENETEEPERADADIESKSEIEEAKSDDIEEIRDVNEQDEEDLAVINSGILEEYNAHIMQLKEEIKGNLKNDLTGLSSSEDEISENNESDILDDISEVCTGSRLDYIKKYLVAYGVKTDDIYALSLKLDSYDVTYTMKYDSVNDKVEFRILYRDTSSTGIVSDSETYFYAEDNALSQRIFSSFKTEGSPYLSYSAYADVIPAELKEEDEIDFTIELADPEDMRSNYDQNADSNGSLLLELLLIGMDTWFDVLYNSDVTIGNFGYSSYKAPATNHIWGASINEEGREYRTCAVCNEIDESEQIEDWELDTVTGIKWKISEGILTVNYKDFLEYDSAPWENASEDITKLILLEGVTGFSEAVTYDLPNLTEIKIPASCTNIEDVWGTFEFNDKLEKIDVSSGNAKFLSVNGVLYNESGEKLLFYPHNKPDEVFTLPNACIEIDDLYSNKVKELNLGSNLKTINGYVGGENVTVIKIPATLENIGGAVFDVTEKLTNIIIDENNPYLCYENYALLSKDKKIIYEVMPCNNTTYEIPDTVEEIFSEAFFNDNKIQNLIISKNVKKIGSGAFAGMKKIEKICLLSTTAQFMGMPFSITGKDEEGTFYVPNEYSKTLVEGILTRCNIKNVKLIVDTSLDAPGDERQEEEPNDSFETAMHIEMGEKVLASIGNKNKKDYYSIN
ncbi:MAG: leucine-rich repeat protein, partial [Lachnospiraceae bacterium]|nr:leucine-rich repeat protein [Lachnospiraceae bacterium]